MSTAAVTLARRATDHGEPTNREIRDEIRSFVKEHRDDHEDLQARLAKHDMESALREARIVQLSNLTGEVSELHDFRIQVKALSEMTRWILGGSLLAAVAAIMTMVVTFAHIVQGS